MKHLVLISSFLLISLASCEKEVKELMHETSSDTTKISNILPNVIPTLDTTITLVDIAKSSGIKDTLTEEEAKKCLYKYFKKQGIVPQSELEGDAYKRESITCIEYDTIYKLNLKPEIPAAVISYWLVPAHGGGHCFQPRRSIISREATAYQISNLDFIPAGFLIDSIRNDATLFISGFNCSKNEVERTIKLKLVTQ
jgi:hypothetical protein